MITDSPETAKGFWLTPEALAHAVSSSLPVCFCYELAPTGRVHAGIVRTLLYAEEVRKELAAIGKGGSVVVRVNDRAAEKTLRFDRLVGGAAVAGYLPTGGVSTRSALSRLLDDLDICCSRFEMSIDETVLVSAVYSSERFRDLLNRCRGRSDEILSEIAKHQTAPVVLFRPLCVGCRRMYSTTPVGPSTDDHGVYVCSACGFSGTFDIAESEGLLAFKFESALMWHYFGASIDLHGQDHIEAFRASASIASRLSLQVPLPGRVNLTFNDRGEKVSKSRGNFAPIAELTDVTLHELKRRILSTPWHRPLRLPVGY